MSQIRNISPFQLVFSAIVILGSGFLTFACLHEFYEVGILKNINGYPFGAEGPVAGLWQYENAQNYTVFNLVFGFLWLIVFSLNIFSLLIANKKYVNISIFFALIVYVLIQLAEKL